MEVESVAFSFKKYHFGDRPLELTSFGRGRKIDSAIAPVQQIKVFQRFDLEWHSGRKFASVHVSFERSIACTAAQQIKAIESSELTD